MSMVIPYWGIVPTILLYAGIQMTGYFVSRYLNESAPSEQRATVLSFRGLSTNFIYGMVSLMYASLIASIRGEYLDEDGLTGDLEHVIFVESLGWFPIYFVVSLFAVYLIYRLRFR
jgi:hypothetical protein